MPDDRLIFVENAPAILGLRFRHFRGESDYGPIATVLTISQRADHYDRRATAEDIAKAYANSLTNCDPSTDLIMAEVAGELAGYVRGWWEEESSSLYLYKHVGVLLPAWRRQGIGRAMLTWMENHLRDIAEAHPREAKKNFQASVSQFQAGAAFLLERAGYQPVRYFLEMVRPTLDDIREFPLPEGLEVRPVTPDQYRAIWEAANDSGHEEWGSPEPSETAYQEWQKDPLFQPDLWQIAWDRETGKAAGTVLTYIHHEENKQFDRKRGYTEGVGVTREWRRRGLARALIGRSLQAQKAAGMTESALVADSDSTSGVTSLYESCGFQIVKRDTIYRKPF
jgi:mycothiol synthase